MEETINIQTVGDVKYELDKFKKKLDLSSITSEIKKIEMSLDSQHQELKTQIENKFKELETVKNTTVALDSKQSTRLSLLENDIQSLQKTLTTTENSIKNFTDNIKQVKSFETTVKNALQTLTEEIDSRFTKTEAKKALKEIQDVVEQNRKELMTKIGHIGGGSKPLRILNNGTDISKRYADVNFKPGSNITITAVDNNTTRQVDVTIDASGGGAGFTLLAATGTIDGNNLTFTFTSKPVYIISDGIWYRENHNWSWSGSTATMTVPPTDDIYGFK